MLSVYSCCLESSPVTGYHSPWRHCLTMGIFLVQCWAWSSQSRELLDSEADNCGTEDMPWFFVCLLLSFLFVLLSCCCCLVSCFRRARDQTCSFMHVKQVLFHSTTPQPTAVVLMAYLLNGLSWSLPRAFSLAVLHTREATFVVSI